MIYIKEVSFNQAQNWDESSLGPTGGTLFQTYSWQKVWLRHFPRETVVLWVYEGNQVFGVGSFARGGSKVIEFLGTAKV